MTLRRVPKYQNYISEGSALRRSNLKVVSCFLCRAHRRYPDGKSVYLCQMARWPTLHVHLACYDAALENLRSLSPDNPFLESLA